MQIVFGWSHFCGSFFLPFPEGCRINSKTPKKDQKLYFLYCFIFRGNGVKISELNVEFGDVKVNCNESFLANKKHAATVGPNSSVDAPSKTTKSDKKSSGAQSKIASLRKQVVDVLEKVIACFTCLS